MEIYTVRSGDTVYSIARRFSVPVSRIVNDNLLSDASRWVKGSKLVVNGGVSDEVTRPPSANTPPSVREPWSPSPYWGIVWRWECRREW